ncbi:ferredoxin subunit of nitrite reductase and ring-hydroxylating dioxygenase [Mycobacteroides abscessus subsp. bolletii]|nr:non-heme iron oxygenase ferredoxin subunit [Mycobacteroides abscessus]MDO3333899.1 non-heme iron oxygenase ferredoxin subunit [Mycobacteroides abscessus subsp. bolletii]QSM91747.1 non-heme iron oxygenase ferredoxin subunit [Mycobacteroides abscessus subsp. bolletii]SKS88453.1 ferredoxin subunit of nitrite reductase and ring-hydroxylating dioxygenase [Mycobacteroides abscessus subsp. bolletii]SKT11418.1 ferredoxin subunit of nitrite reductase and ring-hydroxylating dioxygenase [Mycobacteroide
MQRRRVCAVEEIPPGSMKLVSAGKFGVGVYNVHGEFFAIANYCSHEGAPLCSGLVGGTNEFNAETGEMSYVRDGEIVRCPWHQWEFDLRTGQTLSDPDRRIRTYRVDIHDGEVFVTV